MKKNNIYNIKYVFVVNGRVVYRPYIKKKNRHESIMVDSSGKLKPPIALGRDGDEPDKIYKAYLAAKEQLNAEKTSLSNTLGSVVKKYMASTQYGEIASSSQKRHQNLKKVLDHPIKINGQDKTLSDLHIKDINKPLFQALAEKRFRDYQAKGRKGNVQVNREITFLSGAIKWGINFITDIGITEHPLSKFIKLKEVPDNRYVTDKEYNIQFSEAPEIADYLQPIFELSYLLATRGIETLDIKLSHCTDEGIRTYRRKGSKDNIIEWSTRLYAAYEMALTRHKNIKVLPIDPYLITGFSGGKFNKSSFDDAMQRLKAHMEEKGLSETYWTLHQLKSKGVSDSEDKHIAGHKTEQMRQKYDTKVHTKKPVK